MIPTHDGLEAKQGTPADARGKVPSILQRSRTARRLARITVAHSRQVRALAHAVIEGQFRRTSTRAGGDT
jgi:hypothetical protein